MLQPREILAAISHAFAQGQSLAIISVVPAPAARLLVNENGVVIAGSLAAGAALDAAAAIQAAQFLADDRQEIVTAQISETRLLFEMARPPRELIVCGGGHVGQAVAQLGVFLGFLVTVIDDRAEFVSRARFPDERIRLISDDFVTALRSLFLTPAMYVVLVTRGHKHDEMCLREVIDKPVKYLGMIGSRRRTTTIRAHLKREGVMEEWLQRIYAPIGLDVGAQTPEEIAVAIFAEIILLRRGGTGEIKSAFVRKQ